jgi:hypothetical protein
MKPLRRMRHASMLSRCHTHRMPMSVMGWKVPLLVSIINGDITHMVIIDVFGVIVSLCFTHVTLVTPNRLSQVSCHVPVFMIG